MWMKRLPKILSQCLPSIAQLVERRTVVVSNYGRWFNKEWLLTVV